MLTHAGFQFSGLHGEIREAAWLRRQQTSEVFGLDGAVLLDGGRQPRDISTEIWVYNNFNSTPALQAYLKNVHKHAGKYGVLNETGRVVRSWSKVVFQSLDIQRGPIWSPRLGWFVIGNLNFVELAP